MLTRTYALLSLSIEQKRVHNLLSSAQHLLQISVVDQRLDNSTLKLVIKKFARLAASCRKRKVDIYILPALRNATHQADARLGQMASSRLIGRQLLDAVKAWAKLVIDGNETETTLMHALIVRRCDDLLDRLTTEEIELLPLAQQVISNDVWFDMGAEFLLTDTVRKAHQSAARTALNRATSPHKTTASSLAFSDPLISLAVSGYAYSSNPA
ncbi:hypothetical protein [Glaciimonas immobilis]|uniref:Hemerythrin-like domain-containing protein n=1 Tax=Glaciimonas immobilis TaxID=728004 RepID=A0A840RT98_9BURK|nr:hypothetical protein [Glaciimonas immobilis]KAF3999788.1 hypothetical protein HAV38_00935 [Glaciimonas immobilis]MBB5200258.1 hemerythrin-like domain-containing protein [Glaciimonas immobilis]